MFGGACCAATARIAGADGAGRPRSWRCPVHAVGQLPARATYRGGPHARAAACRWPPGFPARRGFRHDYLVPLVCGRPLHTVCSPNTTHRLPVDHVLVDTLNNLYGGHCRTTTHEATWSPLPSQVPHVTNQADGRTVPGEADVTGLYIVLLAMSSMTSSQDSDRAQLVVGRLLRCKSAMDDDIGRLLQTPKR